MSRTVSQKWLASNHGVQRRLLEAEQRGLHGYCEDGGRSVCCPNDDKKPRKEGRREQERRNENEFQSDHHHPPHRRHREGGRTEGAASSGPSPTCCQNRVRHRHCSKEDLNHGGSREGSGRSSSGLWHRMNSARLGIDRRSIKKKPLVDYGRRGRSYQTVSTEMHHLSRVDMLTRW